MPISFNKNPAILPLNLTTTGFSDKLQQSIHPITRLLLLLLTIWIFAPEWLHLLDETAASVDQSVWLLIILSLITFLVILIICWWLMQYLWNNKFMPAPRQLAIHFKTLTLWQQISFYWASFALLLLTASICLVAIC
ncbi:hypothetical protein [Pedobacter antarcticus]|uniref:hypothetical protein n=1 Tax=Pedobacter antarcticus TaxID=34086 RepID=UPI00292FD93D|nr:hypothetical protein [Pedobacter antarcticus]